MGERNSLGRGLVPWLLFDFLQVPLGKPIVFGYINPFLRRG